MLELGCASGGNLIPMAARWPKADFTGIDISPVQIQRAQHIAAGLSLNNVRFLAQSITDLDQDLGTFDYIIAHGLLSWVPQPVQQATFQLFARHLSPDGIGFLSYNTLPGWHAVRPVRDMLMQHCAGLSNPQKKVAAALELLDWILAAAPADNDPWRQSLRQERHTIATSPVAYVMHEYFESSNTQFYFRDVVDQITGAGLTYLGDAHPKRMVTGPVPPRITEFMNRLPDDCQREQYVDYLVNQRFRASLLCRPHVAVNHQPDPARILDYCLSSPLSIAPGSPAVDLRQDQPVTFVTPQGGTVRLGKRAATALLVILTERKGRPIPAQKLITEAANRTGIRDKAELRKALLDVGLKLLFAECLFIHSEESPDTASLSRKPLAFAPARLLAKEQSFLPTARLGNHFLSDQARQILALCDGNTPLSQMESQTAIAIGQIEILLRSMADQGFLIH